MSVKVRWISEDTYEIVGGSRDFWLNYEQCRQGTVVSVSTLAAMERGGVEVEEV